jgi:futalosine hydrolase
MRKEKPIGIITAVPFEVDLLLGETRRKRPLGRFTTGRLSGRRVVLIAGGIGAANAANAATVLIEKHAPASVILTGIGGAYPGGGALLGDVVAAEREIYADLGVLTKEGFQDMKSAGLELLRRGRRKYYNIFPLHTGMLREAEVLVPGLKRGVFLTVSTVTGTRRRARELRERHDALCENMEGAAVAQVCEAYGVPLLELRGMSNMVEERDLARWRKREAAEKAQQAVLHYLGGTKSLPGPEGPSACTP